MNKGDKKDMLLFYLKLFLFVTALYGILYFSILINNKNSNYDSEIAENILFASYSITTYIITRKAVKTYISKTDEDDV
jgi:hypothetical protein